MISKILDTAVGKVEFTRHRGKGTPIFFIHGTPGNYSQAQIYLKELIDDGYDVISISRPGYGYTESRFFSKTFIRQARIIEAVMDRLRIDKVYIYAVSGGAAIAYKFLNLFSHRCKGVILESPVLGVWAQNKKNYKDYLLNMMYVSRYISKAGRLLFRYFPVISITMLLQYFGHFSYPQALAMAKEINRNTHLKDKLYLLFKTAYPEDHREGFVNDLEELSADTLYSPNNTIPTLLIHGDMDREIAIQPIRNYFEGLKNVTIFEVKDGHHLLMIDKSRRKVVDQVEEFIDEIEVSNANINIRNNQST